MSCYHPLTASQAESGAVRIGDLRSVWPDCVLISVPCGQCIGCKHDRARAWAVRMQHEAQDWDSNLFVTLTYDDAHLPASRSLEYPHFQKFLKRLRRRLQGVSCLPNGDRPIRFFCAGEYGDKTLRPHYHAVLFNTRFPDQVPAHKAGEFSSQLLAELWGMGRTHIGTVTPESTAYVAGYTLRKKYGRRSAEFYEDVVDLRTGELTARRPEFACMSRRPGIGARWFDRFGRDLFPQDFAVTAGKKRKVPRYYWDAYQRVVTDDSVEEIRHVRKLRAMDKREDNTPERRAVREEVHKRRTEFYAPRDKV